MPFPVSRDEAFLKVKDVVEEVLRVSPDDITIDSNYENLGADSIDNITLIIALEDALEISITEAEAKKLKTVGDTVDYILYRLSKQED